VSLGDEATLLVVLADVSERKRALKALRVSEERYCGLADATSDLIFSFDRNLNLTGLNRAAARSLGLEMKEALGRHLADLGLPPRDVSSLETEVRRGTLQWPAGRADP